MNEEQLRDYNAELLDGIMDAHKLLTKYGIGKPHYNLFTRIDMSLRWYKVTSILPDNNQIVLVYFFDKQISIATFYYTQSGSGWFDGNTFTYPSDSGIITHWKYLPNPPVEE